MANKIRAYGLQDEGLDTVEANEHLGFRPDQRDYGIGVQILRELGVCSMQLLSNNPRKLVAIEGYGLSATKWLPLEIPASASTLRYLTTKRNKLGTSCADSKAALSGNSVLIATRTGLPSHSRRAVSTPWCL